MASQSTDFPWLKSQLSPCRRGFPGGRIGVEIEAVSWLIDGPNALVFGSAMEVSNQAGNGL